jgi:hypothetical protein
MGLRREGDKISFNGFKGRIIKVTETYRKNVLIVSITELPKQHQKDRPKIVSLGLFEYPDGRLELMNKIYE